MTQWGDYPEVGGLRPRIGIRFRDNQGDAREAT